MINKTNLKSQDYASLQEALLKLYSVSHFSFHNGSEFKKVLGKLEEFIEVEREIFREEKVDNFYRLLEAFGYEPNYGRDGWKWFLIGIEPIRVNGLIPI